jgi:hypothetical protein
MQQPAAATTWQDRTPPPAVAKIAAALIEHGMMDECRNMQCPQHNNKVLELCCSLMIVLLHSSQALQTGATGHMITFPNQPRTILT